MTGFATRQVHSGAGPDSAQRARATPIYQTAAYTFDDTDHAEGIFSLTTPGNLYSRTGNPTSAVLEQRLAALEGGVAAVATASGQSAVALALLALAGAGDHVVAATSLYGGTFDLLDETFADLGIRTTFVDPDDEDAWRRAVEPRTRAFFAESIGNPRGDVLDVELVAGIAHDAGVPLVVDSTLASPYLLRPIEHGADVVVHSTTKLLGGHGTALGGIVVDGGTFDFGAEPARWPRLTAPYRRYGGLVLWDRFGAEGGAYAALVRTRYLHDLGPSSTPFTSFLLLQGVETLDVRVERQVASTLEIARVLEGLPGIEAVHYAGLTSSPWHALAQRYLPRGAGAVLAFDVAGGAEQARAVVDGLRLFSHVANIGDVRSLAIHPATTTHSHLEPADQAAAGVRPSTVRLSVGLESVADLVADLTAAVAASHVRPDAREPARAPALAPARTPATIGEAR
ncbi:O-acetylhomoserine aminocarboxypropyltransferase/cysteine synthase family protein [Cellulomonas fimi]|uniref:O-acetylhomoserine/O-acetylserine sulfhydrylase n=1 Tax=Cellulomonas fimi TaxID=1708 RepID=A0A7Y0QI34_CELFI|nr:PLP-dependent transferase [Cellulomonas fimi]NMR20504.1 hypothetical protein [Cellulomonas fimi]